MEKERARKELAAALSKILSPPPATNLNWREAKVIQGILTDPGVPFWTLVKMRPILEADTNTTSYHMRASNQRGQNGDLVTTIWSNKILNTLEIHWGSGVVEKHPQNRSDGTMFDQRHPEQLAKVRRDISFTHLPPEWTSPAIAISFHGQDGKITGSTIPFDHTPYITFSAFVPSTYPIGAMPALAKERGSQSCIILIDTDKKMILGKIPLPNDLSGRPTFMLDKENDMLLVTQFELNWLIAIDLRGYMETNYKERFPQK